MADMVCFPPFQFIDVKLLTKYPHLAYLTQVSEQLSTFRSMAVVIASSQSLRLIYMATWSSSFLELARLQSLFSYTYDCTSSFDIKHRHTISKNLDYTNLVFMCSYLRQLVNLIYLCLKIDYILH